MQVTVSFHNLSEKPTIYSVLKAKLGREPTNAELKADVQRILSEARA